MAGKFAHFGSRHGADVREGRIDDRIALPEEDAVVERGCSGPDVLLQPAILAVKGVGAISAGCVLKSEGTDAECFAFALVSGGSAAVVVVFLESSRVGRVGLRRIGKGCRRGITDPSVECLGQQGGRRGRQHHSCYGLMRSFVCCIAGRRLRRGNGSARSIRRPRKLELESNASKCAPYSGYTSALARSGRPPLL